MFSRDIVCSGRFLQLPSASRLLYYDLGMAADDDGAVEAYTVLRMTGATMDDLEVLEGKGYVAVLDEELVTCICDWRTNNHIRKDRYTPSYHTALLHQFRNDEMMEADGQPNGNQMATQDSIGQESTGQESTGERAAAAPPATATNSGHSKQRDGSLSRWDRALADLEAEL
jgi:hypothetical protein